MKKLIALCLISFAFIPYSVSAEIVVVISGGSGISSASFSDIKRIFSGTQSVLDGKAVTPIDLPENSSTREQFYRGVLRKTPAQMDSYWARRVFTGQGNRHREASNVQTLRELLLSPGSGYIGYLERDQVTNNMTILYSLD